MQEKIKNLLKRLKMNESMISTILGLVTLLMVGVLVFNYAKTNRDWWGEKKKEVKEEQQTKVKEEGQTKREATALPGEYTVKKGDHLWKIAEKVYGSGYNWVDIARENHLRNPGRLYVGQKLKLPKVSPRKVTQVTQNKKASKPITGDTYKVEKGDTLWSIAVRAYQDGYKWPELARANKLANPNVIEVGQKLVVPR